MSKNKLEYICPNCNLDLESYIEEGIHKCSFCFWRGNTIALALHQDFKSKANEEFKKLEDCPGGKTEELPELTMQVFSSEPEAKNFAEKRFKKIDIVNHPKHYTFHPSGIECIQITRHLNFNIGNSIKYLWRAGIKDEKTHVEDLEKAIWYIQDEIKRISFCNMENAD